MPPDAPTAPETSTAPIADAGTAEGAAPEGVEGETPPVAAAEPEYTPEKLGKWSSKLARQKDRLATDRAALAAERAAHAELVERGKLFEGKKLRPIIEAYAKKNGLTFEKAYSALTHEAVNGDEPTVEDIVEQKLAAEREAQAKKLEAEQLEQRDATIKHFMTESYRYINAKLASSPHDYLKVYNPNEVAKFAVNHILQTWQSTGQEIPLDKVLADMNAFEKQKHDLHRLRQGDSQVQPNPEREDGAGSPAKHEARKRGSPTTLSNAHAAQRANGAAAKEDLSDQALSAAAVKALRSIPGWH